MTTGATPNKPPEPRVVASHGDARCPWMCPATRGVPGQQVAHRGAPQGPWPSPRARRPSLNRSHAGASCRCVGTARPRPVRHPVRFAGADAEVAGPAQLMEHAGRVRNMGCHPGSREGPPVRVLPPRGTLWPAVRSCCCSVRVAGWTSSSATSAPEEPGSGSDSRVQSASNEPAGAIGLTPGERCAGCDQMTGSSTRFTASLTAIIGQEAGPRTRAAGHGSDLSST